MARPTKFDPAKAERILALILAGTPRTRAATEAGLAVRTVQLWLARGRRGEKPFSAWSERLDEASDAVRRAKVRARYKREAVEAKDRWQAFKAARQRWWLDRLGPVEFWSRRFEWCQSMGRTQSASRSLRELRASLKSRRQIGG